MLIRQTRHAFHAILPEQFEFGHNSLCQGCGDSYSENRDRILYLGSTGCQPVAFGRRPNDLATPNGNNIAQHVRGKLPRTTAWQPVLPRQRQFARVSEFVIIPAMSDKPAKLKIGDRQFTSRLLVGTGKFSSNEVMRDALVASGTEIVTVALRRADLSGKGDPFANILDFIDPKRFLVLPNTSGARNAEEAVRLARLAATAGLPTWLKLEIHPDPRYLLPDGVETLAAAEILVKEGFTVLPYINADPVLAKRLQDVGTATVMPLGSPIGSNRGIETRAQIEIIIEQATVPVVVDAGLGAPSQAAEALEMGADAVLVNTAIAIASDPVRMAQAFRKAVEAGREAREIGLAERLGIAAATSPLTGFLNRND
jgi:thiazole synthase